jgi:hypothetical protein
MPRTRTTRLSPFAKAALTALAALALANCQQSLNVGGNKPSQPTNLVATAGNGQVSLMWDAATDAASYTVYYKSGSAPSSADNPTSVGAATSTVVTSLANDTTYYFAVSAANINGTSALSSIAVATPAAPAAAPVVTVTPIDHAFILSWPPVSGALSYNVYIKVGTGVTALPGGYTQKLTNVLTSDVAGKKQYTLSGLNNTTTYSVIVTAVNTGGESQPSVAAQASPGAGGVSLTPGNGTIQVTWNAVGGATGYKIYWLDGSGVTTSTYTGVYTVPDGVTTTYPIPGLSNWHSYEIVLTSLVSASESSPGAPSSATPGTPPAAPSLTVDPHASDGTRLEASFSSAHTTNYVVSWSPATLASPANVSATSYEITGLGVNTAYTVNVVATNSFGSSSAATVGATTGGPPAAPSTPTLTPSSSTQLGVSWSAGSGPAATGYTVTYADNASFTSSQTQTPSSSPITLSGLSLGSTYYVKITANNSYGTSNPSSTASALLDRAPSAPTTLTPSSGTQVASSTFGLSWSGASDPDGGTLSYDLYWGTPTPTNHVAIGAGVTSATINAGSNSTTYQWYVVAKDQYGVSSANSTTASFTTGAPPNAPGAPSLSVTGATSFNASWTDGGGAYPATSYRVYYSTGAVSTSSTYVSSVSSPAAIPSLSHGSTYNIMVTALNAHGQSTPSGTSSMLLNRAPTAPTSFSPANNADPTADGTEYPASGTFAISWSGASDPDGDTMSYDLYFGTSATPGYLKTISGGATSTTVAASSNLTKYYWYIIAKDAYTGASAKSATVNFTTGYPAPTAVTMGMFSDITWNWHGSSSNPSGSAQVFYFNVDYDDTATGLPVQFHRTISIQPGNTFTDNYAIAGSTAPSSIQNFSGYVYLCPVGTPEQNWGSPPTQLSPSAAFGVYTP